MTKTMENRIFNHSHASVMGSFLGHTVTGLSFLLLGFIWAIKHPLRFLGRKSKYSLQIENLIYWVELLEWGGVAIVCSSGALLEQCLLEGPCFQLYNEATHRWMFLNLWQHSTMHAFFAMAGVVGVLTRCKFQIPVGLDHLLFSLALFNEGKCAFHGKTKFASMGFGRRYPMFSRRSRIFVLIYARFTYPGCFILYILFEVWFRNNPILELFRTSMFITQGTWLWQIAFLLWGTSSWDHNDPETYVFMAICYSWHYGSVILFLAFTYGIVYW
uniref:Transmembrane protein 45B n=1 Tax=Anolis carolinensis TaxID=28377 RepID=A0A803TW98_ANOCA